MYESSLLSVFRPRIYFFQSIIESFTMNKVFFINANFYCNLIRFRDRKNLISFS